MTERSAVVWSMSGVCGVVWCGVVVYWDKQKWNLGEVSGQNMQLPTQPTTPHHTSPHMLQTVKQSSSLHLYHTTAWHGFISLMLLIFMFLFYSCEECMPKTNMLYAMHIYVNSISSQYSANEQFFHGHLLVKVCT